MQRGYNYWLILSDASERCRVILEGILVTLGWERESGYRSRPSLVYQTSVIYW